MNRHQARIDELESELGILGRYRDMWAMVHERLWTGGPIAASQAAVLMAGEVVVKPPPETLAWSITKLEHELGIRGHEDDCPHIH